MSRLNESEKRRPDFVPGSPVLLADGQEWQLRRPVVRFVPDDTHDSGFQVRLALSGADRYGDLLRQRDALFDRAEGDVLVAEVAPVELALGKLLLLANYDLTPEEAQALLQFGYDAESDPEGAGIREAVVGVAMGNGPKPSPAGSA